MRTTLPILALSLAGCWLSGAEVDRKLGAGPVDTDAPDADTDVDTDTDTDVDTDTEPVTCADADLGEAVGLDVASGSIAGAGDDTTPSCAGSSAGGPDVALAWTAPSAGCWGFRTAGSAFDTIAYVLDGCDGAELACNDDFNADVPSSEASLALDAGQTVIVVVDGYDASAQGAWSLDVDEGVALVPDLDIGSKIGNGAASGSTAGADTTVVPSMCAYGSGRDVFVRWVAPSSDVWTFELDPFNTSFDAVLSLHRQCAWDAFTCADEPVPFGGEIVYAPIYAGEEVLVRIAGYDDGSGADVGAWRLDITH